jgi:hypothetical protein
MVVVLVGATIVVVRGSLFAFLRRGLVRGLFSCALCVGFWAGFVWGCFSAHWPMGLYAAVADGCVVALAALFADGVLAKLHGD